MTERTNEEWLRDLQGPQRDEAISDLRDFLIRGLRYTLSTRVDSNLDIIVEDFAQEALIKILDNLDTFRGESKLTTWAQKIAVRVAFTELRRKRWKDYSLEDMMVSRDGTMEREPILMADPDPSPEDRSTRAGMVAIVHRLIMEELTARQREAMLYVMVAGMPLEEVAQRMDTNRNALYKLIHDARVRLKRRLAAENLTPEEVLAVFD